jgi:hypothetical protein
MRSKKCKKKVVEPDNDRESCQLEATRFEDNWVPIEFPPNLLEMFVAWRNSTEPNVGWCLLCNSPIKSPDDFVLNTNTHNCEAGRKLEERVASRREKAMRITRHTESDDPEKEVRSQNDHADSTEPQPAERASNAELPKVGIFWEVNGNLILTGVPLAKAEAYGRFLNFPGSHEVTWCTYQQAGAVPTEVEYDEPPRGRVLYDSVLEKFLMYADRCILRNQAMLQQIRRELRLPADTTVGPDGHYRCAKCLGRNERDDRRWPGP